MKIERVDENTVKCFLSNEELEAYDITYKDFVVRSERAKEIVEEIIDQAGEEVGYQPPKFALELQIMVLPDKGMVLTFSEKEPGEEDMGRELLECLKNVKAALTGKAESIEEPNEEEGKAQTGNKESRTQEEEKPAAPTFAVFRFESLRHLCEYADILPKTLRVRSVLYSMNKEYYLYLDKGAASYQRYSRACIQAMEFGSIYAADKEKTVWLEEHAECIISEQALKKLRKD